MRFDIYGRHELHVVREDSKWKVFTVDSGKRVPLNVVIPLEVQEHEIATYLDDLFHEGAKPGDIVRRID